MYVCVPVCILIVYMRICVYVCVTFIYNHRESNLYTRILNVDNYMYYIRI